MTHGSLFSGIGGFDLAAEWMGWENKFHCEWNPFGQKVLKHYWPKAESFTDITKSNFEKYAGTIDVISGGFPCQPYSSAGKRLGKDDPRHLWPEMLRVISEVRPRWVVGENVRGLTNWNGGMVFDEVQSDLETIGFEVIPFLLPAAAVNAPHRRDRIWFVANSLRERHTRTASTRVEKIEKRTIHNEYRKCTGENPRNNWSDWPKQPYVLHGNDGLPIGLDNKTFPKIRRESIKAAGNAIVPQVAFQIFKTIQTQNHDLYSMQAHNA
jgi:DNA (cytosine-5)-methyltransferase 1